MFLNLIKSFFLKKNIRITNQTKIAETNDIAVIINMDSVTDINKLKKILATDIFKGKNISFIDFKENCTKDLVLNQEILSNKSFNWKAEIVDDWALNYISKPYFICLAFSNTNNYVNRIGNIINAQYKFEISDTRNDIFDVSLIYSMSENSDYIEQLKNYLKSFNIIN